MFTYFKRYEIAACVIAVAIPLVVTFIWSTIEGRAMGFTAAGAGVSVVLLLAGLFVAIAIVVVSDMLNTKVRNADEIEDLLGLPVIGRMPALKGGK